mgnify:CR=1 FL=1
MKEMRCAPFSLITACLIVICATIMQALQGYPDALSVSFLVLGVTSVIHHCRLNAWWKRDVWRVLDYLSIAVFAAVACAYFYQKALWRTTCLLIVMITGFIWSGAIPPKDIPAVHACIHMTTCISVVYLMLHRRPP